MARTEPRLVVSIVATDALGQVEASREVNWRLEGDALRHELEAAAAACVEQALVLVGAYKACVESLDFREPYAPPKTPMLGQALQ